MNKSDLRLKSLEKITYLLLSAGFNARQRGYRFLREAVWIAYDEPEMLTSITKLLYPEVAKRFGTTDKHVERAIRNSIETAWVKVNAETLKEVFGGLYNDRSTRPTNKEVIETLVKILEDDCELYENVKHYSALLQ